MNPKFTDSWNEYAVNPPIIMWHVPPENQGQIVIIAYGFLNGELYRRIHDRSELVHDSVKYQRAAQLTTVSSRRRRELDLWEPWNNPAPKWIKWNDCLNPVGF